MKGNISNTECEMKKKWKLMTQRQKRWALKKAQNLFERTVAISQQPLTNPERRRLIHSVYGMIRSRGIQIPYGEVYRVLSSRIAKWNRRFWIRQARDKPPFDEETSMNNDFPTIE